MDDTPVIGRVEFGARTRSKALLGAQFRAEVAAYIAIATGPFWARSVAIALEIPENKVSAELSRFSEQNLLVAMDGADSWDRRRLLVKLPAADSYWAMALGLVRQAAGDVALNLDLDPGTVFASYLEQIHRADPVALDQFR